MRYTKQVLGLVLLNNFLSVHTIKYSVRNAQIIGSLSKIISSQPFHIFAFVLQLQILEGWHTHNVCACLHNYQWNCHFYSLTNPAAQSKNKFLGDSFVNEKVYEASKNCLILPKCERYVESLMLKEASLFISTHSTLHVLICTNVGSHPFICFLITFISLTPN